MFLLEISMLKISPFIFKLTLCCLVAGITMLVLHHYKILILVHYDENFSNDTIYN